MTTETKRRTVADKRVGLREWRERVLANQDDYATDEWKDRALGKIEEIERVLDNFADDMPLLSLHEALATDSLTEVEKWVVRWQHRDKLGFGSFTEALLDAGLWADESNAERLARGFPELMEAIRRWRTEQGFAAHMRGLPFDFSL